MRSMPTLVSVSQDLQEPIVNWVSELFEKKYNKNNVICNLMGLRYSIVDGGDGDSRGFG